MDNYTFKNGKLLSELSSQYEAFYGKVNVPGMNSYLDIFISQFKFSFFAELPKDLKIFAFVLKTDTDGDVSLIVKYKFEYFKRYFWWELNLIGNDIDKNEIKEIK